MKEKSQILEDLIESTPGDEGKCDGDHLPLDASDFFLPDRGPRLFFDLVL
ncbi:MAG: hypothetical protein JRE61_04940 [Deltaproteobacteria bacterium]|jgi:hypothetical protein|nr:hypothetical protein [Deltaproteobacteria bacterium]